LDQGVVYGSKGADYAEYLPKLNPTEQFLKGEIVGVHNGRISKNTRNAEQILAITSQPIVLGNMPSEEDESGYEKVAFLGQVPVFVQGPVHLGDYIVASGKHDGVGHALAADELTPELVSLVLGKAWSEFDGETVTVINTSIGLRPTEIANIIKKQDLLQSDLQAKVQTQQSESETMGKDLERIKTKLGVSEASYNQ